MKADEEVQYAHVNERWFGRGLAKETDLWFEVMADLSGC